MKGHLDTQEMKHKRFRTSLDPEHNFFPKQKTLTLCSSCSWKKGVSLNKSVMDSVGNLRIFHELQHMQEHSKQTCTRKMTEVGTKLQF